MTPFDPGTRGRFHVEEIEDAGAPPTNPLPEPGPPLEKGARATPEPEPDSEREPDSESQPEPDSEVVEFDPAVGGRRVEEVEE